MLRNLLLTCSLAFLLSSCKHGPKLMVCVSDPSEGGFDCYDENLKVNSFLKYQDSDKYIALPPDDAQTLLTYFSQGKN